MMSPGDSDLQQRIINAFIKFFFNLDTSANAVKTTIEILRVMEQEYIIHDNTSWTAIITSKVAVPFAIGKTDHLEKINICKQALENLHKVPVETLGAHVVGVLLDFFRKSCDWHVPGFVRGASVNMRLACELLHAAGIKDDCGPFLQKYSADFLQELEAATDKLATPASAAVSELGRGVADIMPAVITPLQDSMFPGTRKKVLNFIEPMQKQTTDNLLYTMD